MAAAKAVADEVYAKLSPYCDRIAIAGSVRRLKPEVNDVELLYVPRIIEDRDLFGEPLRGVDFIEEHILQLIVVGYFAYWLNKNGQRTFGPSNKFLVHQVSGVKVDLFTATLENCGMALVVRTGPKEFNIRMMQRFRELGKKGHAYGGVEVNGTEVNCPDELTVFDLLEWPYLQPSERH